MCLNGQARPRISWLLIALMSLAGGCAVSDDPRQGGLLGGIHGLSSGAYARRIQDREDRLQRLDQVRQELEAERDLLSRDKAAKQARVAQIRGELARIDRESALLAQRIHGQQTQLGAQDARRARLDRELAQLRTQIDAVDRDADAGASVEALEAERTRLEDEYRALLNLYLELGK